MPERPDTEIEPRQDVVRVLLEGQQQHRRETVGSIDHPAFPIGQRRKRKEGPVDEGMAVDENEPRPFFWLVLWRWHDPSLGAAQSRHRCLSLKNPMIR